MKNLIKKLKSLRLYFVGSTCGHDYEIVNQFEMMSEFDIVVSNGKQPTSWNSTKRRVVTDYKCKKCNKIRRLQAITPN